MHITKDELELFPEEVVITGLPMDRLVYIDGKLLEIARSRRVETTSETFDWGYQGRGPAQLSFAILYHFLAEHYVDDEGNLVPSPQEVAERFARGLELAHKLYKALNIVLIRQMPKTTFQIRANLRGIVAGLAGYGEPILIYYLYYHDLISGELINRLGFSGNREDIIPSDEVKNKVLVDTATGTAVKV